MTQIWLRADLRSPDFGIGSRRMAQLHLEQCAWAENHGFEAVQLPEHHGCPDGYDPSPFVLAGAIAARTSKLRVHPSAVLLPLLDPIRVAEDAVMVDNISNGRLDMTIGLGYVPWEFATFGVKMEDRAKLVDAKLKALISAFTGEPFEYDGRPARVFPLPARKPRPTLYIGGGVKATARRAAQLGDGFLPASPDLALHQLYRDTCRELGKEPGPIINVVAGPQFIYVTEDPDKAWRTIEPHAMYETNIYGKWGEAAGTAMPFTPVNTLGELKATGIYAVLTPDECIALAHDLDAKKGVMIFNAGLAGLNEDFSWASLELFASKVLPHINPTYVDTPGTVDPL